MTHTATIQLPGKQNPEIVNSIAQKTGKLVHTIEEKGKKRCWWIQSMKIKIDLLFKANLGLQQLAMKGKQNWKTEMSPYGLRVFITIEWARRFIREKTADSDGQGFLIQHFLLFVWRRNSKHYLCVHTQIQRHTDHTAIGFSFLPSRSMLMWLLRSVYTFLCIHTLLSTTGKKKQQKHQKTHFFHLLLWLSSPGNKAKAGNWPTKRWHGVALGEESFKEIKLMSSITLQKVSSSK